ncbi:nuclease [Rhodobacter phage RcMamaDuck]|nr:nuclease [Rhodobacter phage RcMamaDuck]
MKTPVPPPPGLKTFPAPKKRRGTPEAEFQRALVRDLRSILLPPFVLHHSANEVRRGGREGRIAQGIAEGMGVHPGFADLVLLSAKQTVFFELKSATGTLSEDQIAFRDFVRGQGHGWALVRTLDDALAALKAFGIPTRIKRT